LGTLLLAASSGCGGAPDTAIVELAVYGGTDVAPGEWEAVVAMRWCTGVIVADRLVVYAAHCGTDFDEIAIGTDAFAPQRRIPVSGCRAHPDAALGNGRDIALCSLRESAGDVPSIELMTETEAAAVQPGAMVRQVGYGKDSNAGAFGTKRETVGYVEKLGDNIVIAGKGGGTCEGDSGGPALLRLDPPNAAGAPEWRVLGLLSGGTSFDCAVSTDHYSSASVARAWIEDESGIAPSVAASNPPADTTGCQIGRPRDSQAATLAMLFIATLVGLTLLRPRTRCRVLRA
jgi:hypothetical protein